MQPEVARQAGAKFSDQDCAQDTDAMLQRGVAVLRDSGRLSHEDDELDRALVLAILGSVFPMPSAKTNE